MGTEWKKGYVPVMFIDRPALTIDERRRQLFEAPHSNGIAETAKKKLKALFICSKERWMTFLYTRIPILEWLPKYDVKRCLIGDLIAGITVAIMHIPQGMGFALLANVPAICGIYMAFYQNLIYALLATSRHNAMGSFAVITIMTGKVVNELATFPPDASNDPLGYNSTGEEPVDITLLAEDGYTPVQIATVVTFMVGVWHMTFGFLQMGSLSVFLSDMLVSGFTTAAAFHVLTSLIRDLLGIVVKEFYGPLKLIYTYVEIGKAVPSVNLATLAITIVTMTVLIFTNELLKPIALRYTRIPIPIELIVVILGTSSSYFFNFSETGNVSIIGIIPTGFPPASVPPLELIGKVVVDSLVIAIVSYTVNFSLAKLFAARRNYSVDATQELYATGVGNLFSSFFACPPTASALARALIQESVGGETQLASLIVCAIIVLVLLYIGPLFQVLPKTILASIIIVALKGMFMQVKDMLAMWRVSKIEAATWLVTFFSVVIIDIDFGLLAGIIFSLFILLSKTQRPVTFKLGRVPNTDLYLNMDSYPQAKEVSGLRMFRIVGAIHFANLETLKRMIVKGTKLDPKANVTANLKKPTDCHNHNGIRFLILDVSGVIFVDTSGGKFLEKLRHEYEQADINLCFAGLSDCVLEIMEKTGCLKEFPPEHLFHSMHDAVALLTS